MCELFAKVAVRRRYRTDRYSATAMCGLGSFSETVIVLEEQLVRVETDLPDRELALIGCAIVTGAGAVFNRAKVVPGATVAAFGCGGVGSAVIQAARIAGAVEIIAIDPDEQKLEVARALGATSALSPAAGPVAEQILEVTRGRGVDAAIESVGGLAAVTQALASTARGGICVQLGTLKPGERVEVPPGHQERIFTTSVYGSGDVRRDIPRLVALTEAGQLNLRAMISRTTNREASAVNDALFTPGPGTIRSVISFEEP